VGTAPLDLAFTYDAAERLTAVDNGSNQRLKEFNFATANVPSDNFVKGRLQTARRHNRLDSGKDIRVTETFLYGNDTNVKTRKTTVEDYNESTSTGTTIQEFSQDFLYDLTGDLTSIGYPAASAAPLGLPTVFSSIDNRFSNGFLVAVPGYAGSTSANGFTYHPNGMLKEVRHADAPATTDTYDIDTTNGMARPSKITFSGVNTTCTPPAAPTITSPDIVCPNITRTATTSATGVSYLWTIQNGSIVSGATSQNMNYHTGASGTVVLTLTVSNSCGSASASKSIPIYAPSTATLRSSTTVNADGSTTLYADLSAGASPWQLQLSDTQFQTVFASPAQFNVHPSVTTTYTLTTLYDNCGVPGSVSGSATVTVTPPLPVPTGLVATAESPTSVLVAWNAVAGANYEVLRSRTILPGMNELNYDVVSPVLTSTTFHDMTAAPNTSYFYRVRSVNGTGAGAPRSAGSAYDVATTVMFSSLGPPSVSIQASHFTNELRPAVNALRALAGQSAAVFSTDLAQHNPIRAVHITELRAALDQARSALGLPAIQYAESITTSPRVPIKKSHLEEIRGGLK
jgi:hypothetical protein